MFSNFAEFFTCVKEARFDFGVIWDAIVSLYYDITVNPDISVMWDGLMKFVNSAYGIIMTVLVIFSVAVALFGRKMMGFLKFLFFFTIGFTLGTHFLAAVIPPEVNIPAWTVGLVIALISGVLYRFLYIILYSAVTGYGMYVLAYHGFYIKDSEVYTTGKAVVCLIVALIAIAVFLIFRKYVEMLGTAVLGAWLATFIFAYRVYNFTAWPVFSGATWVGIFVPSVIIGFLGFVIQVKTRRRY